VYSYSSEPQKSWKFLNVDEYEPRYTGEPAITPSASRTSRVSRSLSPCSSSSG